MLSSTLTISYASENNCLGNITILTSEDLAALISVDCMIHVLLN